MKPALIFDFDGVLADSFECLYELNSAAMGLIGRRLSARAYRALFRGNIHASRKRLLPLAAERRIVERFRDENFGRYYRRTRLFPFAERLVRRLARDHGLAIVSSTDRRFIVRLLEERGLREDFVAVFGGGAHSKRDEVIEACRRLKRPPSDVIFVTDTVGDVKVGRELGLKTVAVSWGFQPAAWLRAARPTRCVRKPDELVAHLKSLCRRHFKVRVTP